MIFEKKQKNKGNHKVLNSIAEANLMTALFRSHCSLLEPTCDVCKRVGFLNYKGKFVTSLLHLLLILETRVSVLTSYDLQNETTAVNVGAALGGNNPSSLDFELISKIIVPVAHCNF